MAEISVLFICSGNICRSPTAQGVFEHKVVQAGLGERIFVDSAGTHGFHIGSRPDSRAQRAAERRGFDLSRQRSRRVEVDDFANFDYLIGMDRDNIQALREVCPPANYDKLSLFMQFVATADVDEVPDPYYGGTHGFERVLDLVEQASDALLEHVRDRL
ncbi:MAG: low molecular weight phosphotyrosine protein phosphatase [Gammaproteobacteria bacterium]|nr:low molecular weight phosphotyrosine protein phosphatase [Gammaproteobacteria bacterium]